MFNLYSNNQTVTILTTTEVIAVTDLKINKFGKGKKPTSYKLILQKFNAGT